MSQQIGDLLDRTFPPDHLGSEAVAQEVSARTARTDPQSRETPTDDGGYRRAQRERSHRGAMAEKDPRFLDAGSAMQQVV